MFEKIYPILSGLLAASIWGGLIIITRLSAASPLSPFDLMALRFVSASVMLFLINKYMIKKNKKKMVITKVDLPKTITGKTKPISMFKRVFLAVNAGVMNNLVLTQALFFVPSKYAILYYTSMSFFGMCGSISFKSKKSIAAALISLSTIIITIANGDKEWKSILGYGLFILAGLNYFSYTSAVRKWEVDMFDATKNVSYLSFCIYMPFYIYYILSGKSSILNAQIHHILILCFYQGCCVSVIALLLYSHAIKHLGNKATMFSSMAPTVSYILSAWILNEGPDLFQWFILSMFILSMLLAIKISKKKINEITLYK